MILALLVYSIAGVLVPPPEGIGWVGALTYHVVLRIVLLPVVAGLAYEGIRLGAAVKSSSVRTSIRAGQCGSPTRRESFSTDMVVGEGMTRPSV
jgi:uncharacterized protein YqhQ